MITADRIDHRDSFGTETLLDDCAQRMAATGIGSFAECQAAIRAMLADPVMLQRRFASLPASTPPPAPRAPQPNRHERRRLAALARKP